MEKITGRTDDMLIIRGVNVFPTQIEERVLKVDGLAPHYQLHITRADNLDRMDVYVERLPEVDAGSTDALASKLQKAIKEFVGVSTTVDVREPGGVPRSEGKAVRVIDER